MEVVTRITEEIAEMMEKGSEKTRQLNASHSTEDLTLFASIGICSGWHTLPTETNIEKEMTRWMSKSFT